MDEAARAKLERDVHDACQRGDYPRALTLALTGYGPELLGFLVAVQPSEAEDTFAELAEALWRSMPRFAWDSSLRTWVYAIARNIMRTNRRDARRREKRGVRAGDSAFERLAARVRTETLAFLKTEKRTRLQALRDALSEEDRMLLVLRVDRRLAWDDIARVLQAAPVDAPLDAGALRTESARLRKRFQVVKDRLRDLARSEGLIE
jgi:RNA polymerase sigma-70 factor (ECF subfamily)